VKQLCFSIIDVIVVLMIVHLSVVRLYFILQTSYSSES